MRQTKLTLSRAPGDCMDRLADVSFMPGVRSSEAHCEKLVIVRHPRGFTDVSKESSTQPH